MDIKKTVSKMGAARRLNVTPARVTALIKAERLTEVFTDDGKGLVSLASLRRLLKERAA